MQRKYPRFLRKVLESDKPCYSFVDTTNMVVVLFTFPSVDTVHKLYKLCELGLLDSYTVDEHIWDECVIHYMAGEPDNTQLLEATKLNLSNAIFYFCIEQGTSGVERNLALANDFYSKKHSDIINGLLGIITEEQDLRETDTFGLYYKVLLDVQKSGKTPQDFIQQYKAMVDGTPPPGDVGQDQNRTVEDVLSEGNLPPVPAVGDHVTNPEAPMSQRNIQSVEGGRVFGGHNTADSARRDPMFSTVFNNLDRISAGELSGDQIQSLNPTRLIGDNREIINGKIIDEEEFVPSKKRKVKRRVG